MIAVVAGIAVVFVFFGNEIVNLFVPSRSASLTNGTTSTGNENNLVNVSVPESSLSEISPGVKMFDISVGDGEEIGVGKTVVLHYVGKFSDGTIFDSSLTRGQPLVFKIAAGALIPGLERGLAGMRVGGSRHIVISPELAYGSAGVKNSEGKYVIPPNSTLVFDVLLVGISGK